jgi:hypothetical protein
MAACPIVTAAKLTLNTTGGPHFSDVDSRDLNYKYIETLYNSAITSGCATGIYCPLNNLSRGQAMVLIVRAKGYTLVNPTTAKFSDVPTTHTYYKFIETAAANGLVQGYNGKFMPDDAITSADLSAVLGKAFPK